MRVERLDPSVAIGTPRYLCSSIGDEGYDGYRDTEALGVVHPPARSLFEQAILDQLAEAERDALLASVLDTRPYFDLFDLNRRFMEATKTEGNAGSDTPR